MPILNNMEELQAALNDPNSPMREKLLHYLSMSPLDPAAAYKEVLKSGNMQGGVMPPEQAAPQPGFGDFMSSNAQPAGGSFAVNGTPQMDASREANPMGVVNLGNSSEVLPTSADGIPAQAAGGMNPESLMKMFSGIGSLAGKDQPHVQTPAAPAPKGNNWNTFKAENFATPSRGVQMSLADILDGRRR